MVQDYTRMELSDKFGRGDMSKLNLQSIAIGNYRIFHNEIDTISTHELHHIWGRVGVLKCCLLNFYGLTHEYHADPAIIRWLREKFADVRVKALNNYQRGLGCRCNIDPRCEKCNMPKLYAKQEE